MDNVQTNIPSIENQELYRTVICGNDGYKKRIRWVRPSPGGFNRHLTFHGMKVDM